jgi:hypothetical protein
MMNHGVVMFRREETDLRIWEMAIGRGQSVAIYAERRLEQSADGSEREPWASALMPTAGEPLRFTPFPTRTDYVIEYARYEPAYDGEFLEMCRDCTGYSGSPAVALPTTASDEEAMRLLLEFDSIQVLAWPYIEENFYVVRRRNLRRPEMSGIRLSSLMGSIHPRDGWGYFLGFFRAGGGVVVFLSDHESDVDGLFEPTEADGPMRKADWLYDRGVIERW